MSDLQSTVLANRGDIPEGERKEVVVKDKKLLSSTSKGSVTRGTGRVPTSWRATYSRTP